MTKTYHISPWRFWLVPGIFFALAAFIGLLPITDPKAGTPETEPVLLIIGACFLAFGVVMILILRRTRLILWDDKIELYQAGYKLETAWANIARIYDEPGYEGLILHSPMESAGARTLSNFRNTQVKGIQLFDEENVQLIAEQRFIPLQGFAYWLNNNQLREDLIRRAPVLNN